MARRRHGTSGGSVKGSHSWQGGRPQLPLRIAAGLGDPERERSLLSSLVGDGDIVLVERCLSADQLLACVPTSQLDAVLAAADLHRLSAGRLRDLARTGVPLVLLVFDPDDVLWQTFPGVVLPLSAGVEVIR